MAKINITATNVMSSSDAYRELFNRDGLQVYAMKKGRFQIKCGSTHKVVRNTQELQEGIDGLGLHQFPHSGESVVSEINEKLSSTYRLEVRASNDKVIHMIEGSKDKILGECIGTISVDKNMVPGRRYACNGIFGGDYMILVPMSAGSMCLDDSFSIGAGDQMYEKQEFAKGIIVIGQNPLDGSTMTVLVDEVYPNGAFKDSEGIVWAKEDIKVYKFEVGRPTTNEDFKAPSESLYTEEDIPTYNPVGDVSKVAPMIGDLKNYDSILSASAGILSDFMKTAKSVAYIDRSSLNKVKISGINPEGQATDGEIEWNVRICSPHYKRSSSIMIPMVMKEGSIDLGKEFTASTGLKYPMTTEAIKEHLGTLIEDFEKKCRGSRYPSTLKADKDVDNLMNGIEGSEKASEYNWVSKDGKIGIINTFHDYTIVYIPTDESKGMGDGVDMFMDEEGNALSPDTPEFDAQMAEYVNDPVLIEAYFPDVKEVEGSKKTGALDTECPVCGSNNISTAEVIHKGQSKGEQGVSECKDCGKVWVNKSGKEGSKSYGGKKEGAAKLRAVLSESGANRDYEEAAGPVPKDGMKLRSLGVYGKGLRDGEVYTLKQSGQGIFDFIKNGRVVHRNTFDTISRWLYQVSQGDRNGLELVTEGSDAGCGKSAVRKLRAELRAAEEDMTPAPSSPKGKGKAEASRKTAEYQPKTGEPCSCKPGIQRDNCPACEGTGMKIDFKKIRDTNNPAKKTAEVGVDKNYVLTVKHDNGTVNIQTSAQSEEGAINKVMQSEGCPRRSIVKVTEASKKTAAAGEPIEVGYYWIVNADVDESSARETGLNLEADNYEAVSSAVMQVEFNVERWLKQNLGAASNTGSDEYGLGGSLWVEKGSPQHKFVMAGLRDNGEESFATSSGTMPMDDDVLFAGVENKFSSVLNVDLYFMRMTNQPPENNDYSDEPEGDSSAIETVSKTESIKTAADTLPDDLSKDDPEGAADDVTYDDVRPILEEKLTAAFDVIAEDYDLFPYESSERIEAVETKSRDGFIPLTDGGVIVKGVTSVNSLTGSGYSVPNAAAQKSIEDASDSNTGYAKDEFIEKYPEIVKKLGEDKIDYHSLYEAGYSTEAEWLSERESDMGGDDSVMLAIRAYYYVPGSPSSDNKETHSLWITYVVNTDFGYHREREDKSVATEEFSFNSIAEFSSKLDAFLAGISGKGKTGGKGKSKKVIAFDFTSNQDLKVGDEVLANGKKVKITNLHRVQDVYSSEEDFNAYQDLYQNSGLTWEGNQIMTVDADSDGIEVEHFVYELEKAGVEGSKKVAMEPGHGFQVEAEPGRYYTGTFTDWMNNGESVPFAVANADEIPPSSKDIRTTNANSSEEAIKVRFGSKKVATSVPDQHQLKILKDTVRNPNKGLFLGGPSAEESEQILRTKFNYTDKQIEQLKTGSIKKADTSDDVLNAKTLDQLKAAVEALGYTVDENDVITASGRFENEHISTVFYNEGYMAGDQGEDFLDFGEGETVIFYKVTPEEQKMFETSEPYFALTSSTQGFIGGAFVSEEQHKVSVEEYEKFETESGEEGMPLASKTAASQAWDVVLDGKIIDTVWDIETDPAEVKRSLVGHDGYDPNIVVQKPQKKGSIKTAEVAEPDLAAFRENPDDFGVPAAIAQNWNDDEIKVYLEEKMYSSEHYPALAAAKPKPEKIKPKGNLLVAYDSSDVYSNQVESNIEQIKADPESYGLDSKDLSDETVKAKAEELAAGDSDVQQMAWDDEMSILDEVITNANKASGNDGWWDVEGRNMGWQQRSGEMKIQINNHDEFLKIFPKTQDVSFEVRDGGQNTLDVTIWHHDAPTGEFRTLIPTTAPDDTMASKTAALNPQAKYAVMSTFNGTSDEMKTQFPDVNFDTEEFTTEDVGGTAQVERIVDGSGLSEYLNKLKTQADKISHILVFDLSEPSGAPMSTAAKQMEFDGWNDIDKNLLS